LLDQGALFQGRYRHQSTYTGPGHVLLATGSYGYVSGMAQNRWYNRAAKRSEAMFFDPGATLLSGETTPDSETSPRNMLGSTVGDELRLASPSSKVIALALKDRGALALAGRTGTAYFLSESTGHVTTSTYYMRELPPWVADLNARKVVDAAFGKTWDRLLPADRYAEIDDDKHELDVKGLGRSFPKPVTGGLDRPGPDFYRAFQHTPHGLDFTFELARAAVEHEALGTRGLTDLLGISISTTDRVGHAHGPSSQEQHDLVVRTDRALESFLADLERRFRPGELVVVFTSDHGAVPGPEWSAERGLTAHRLKKSAVKEAINQALSARFGPGQWVVALEDPSVYLDHDTINSRKLDHALVQQVAGEATLSLPGILGFHTRTQLLNGWLPPTELAASVARSFSPKHGGDLLLVQAPFSFWGRYAERPTGASHGSPYRYDSDVPLILWGAPFRPGFHGETDMVNLAATLSHVLGVSAPAACEGRVLVEALRPPLPR
jgi:hypothetical protein